jgi:hypothetical protein
MVLVEVGVAAPTVAVGEATSADVPVMGTPSLAIAWTLLKFWAASWVQGNIYPAEYAPSECQKPH